MPTTLTRFNRWFQEDGQAPENIDLREAAAQSFKRGDLVAIDATNRRVQAVVAPGNSVTSSTTPKSFGIALADASGVTDNIVPVMVLNEFTRTVLPVNHATPASAVTNLNQIGNSYQLANVSGVGYTVRIDQTSNPVAMIVDIWPNFPVGEQFGGVVVKILAAERHTGG